MSILKRVLFLTVWNIGCLVVEAIGLIFAAAILFWGLLQMQPMVKFIISIRATPDMFDYAWVADMVNFFYGLIPIVFIYTLLAILAFLVVKIITKRQEIESKWWNRIPNIIKGNDIVIPAPKWIDSKVFKVFLIGIATIMLLVLICGSSWFAHYEWNWPWWSGGTLAITIMGLELGIALLFGLRANKKRRESKRQLMGNTKERTI